MNKEQKDHLRKLKLETNIRLIQKYTNGQKEHGGNLWDMSELELLDNSIDEAIDQVVYLLTLRDKLDPPSLIGGGIVI